MISSCPFSGRIELMCRVDKFKPRNVEFHVHFRNGSSTAASEMSDSVVRRKERQITDSDFRFQKPSPGAASCPFADSVHKCTKTIFVPSLLAIVAASDRTFELQARVIVRTKSTEEVQVNLVLRSVDVMFARYQRTTILILHGFVPVRTGRELSKRSQFFKYTTTGRNALTPEAVLRHS